jgi:hypothetical protein
MTVTGSRPESRNALQRQRRRAKDAYTKSKLAFFTGMNELTDLRYEQARLQSTQIEEIPLDEDEETRLQSLPQQIAEKEKAVYTLDAEVQAWEQALAKIDELLASKSEE